MYQFPCRNLLYLLLQEAVYHLSALQGQSPQGQKKPEVRTLVFQTTQISNL